MFRCASFVLLAAAAAAPARAASEQDAPHTTVPVVQAVRGNATVVVDGRLDDEVWRRAPAATAFTQRDPDEGKPLERTGLRLAYDMPPSMLERGCTTARHNGKVHFVVVYNATRFAREKYDHLALRAHLKSMCISFWSCKLAISARPRSRVTPRMPTRKPR